jgi:hypothetical protein
VVRLDGQGRVLLATVQARVPAEDPITAYGQGAAEAYMTSVQQVGGRRPACPSSVVLNVWGHTVDPMRSWGTDSVPEGGQPRYRKLASICLQVCLASRAPPHLAPGLRLLLGEASPEGTWDMPSRQQHILGPVALQPLAVAW